MSFSLNGSTAITVEPLREEKEKIYIFSGAEIKPYFKSKNSANRGLFTKTSLIPILPQFPPFFK